MARQPVMYGWALDKNKRPVPITQARRGSEEYHCPLCEERMIPKKGRVNRHHFARENLDYCDECTPDFIAQLIAGKWLVLELGARMVRGQQANIRWEMSGKRYGADLLKNVRVLVENRNTPYGLASLALQLDTENIRCAFILSIEAFADPALIQSFVSNGIPCIELPPEQFRSGQSTLENLLRDATVHGGWLLLDGANDPSSQFVTAPETLRQILYQSVLLSPYHMWGPLISVGDFDDLFMMGQRLLWLPLEIWQATIGGVRNRLGSDLEIIMQEWPQPDGATIVLYYVILRKTEHAIAVRLFPPGQHVHAQINAGYQMKRTTAEEIARLLATQ